MTIIRDTFTHADDPDELVVEGATVHLERMSRRWWSLTIQTPERRWEITARDVDLFEVDP